MAEGIVGKGGPPPEIAEASLPELKLTQVVKSPSPIVLPVANEAMSPDEALIHPYGEYTIVLAKGKDKIQILDKQGKAIEGLDNTSTIIIDWPLYRKVRGYDVYSMTEIDQLRAMNYGHISTMEFPQHLQAAVREFIKQNAGGYNYTEIPGSAWKVETDKIGATTITKGDGFIILYQGSGSFIAYQTKNAQGIELPPRNWKRMDNINELDKSLPQDIAQEVTILMSAKNLSFSKQIKTGFSVLVDKDRLVVISPGQKIENAVFTDTVSEIKNNVCEDPKNKGVLYYCTNNPQSIFKLNTAKDPGSWQTEAVKLPSEYKNVSNLNLDPTGNFFMFQSGGDFIILAKDSMQKVGEIQKLCQGVLDDQGRIRGVDEKGNLVIYDVNFGQVIQELDKRRLAKVAKGLTADLFQKEEEAKTAAVDADQFRHLEQIKTDFETQFNSQIQKAAKFEDINIASQALEKLKSRLASQNQSAEQIEFLTKGIASVIKAKQQELATPLVAQGLTDLNSKLSGNLTIALLSEAKADLAKLKSLEGFVDDTTRAQIRTHETRLMQQSDEFYRREGPVIEKYGRDIVEREIGRLGQIISKPDFDDWQEHTLPGQLQRLGALISSYPPDAPPETLERLMAFGKQLRDMDREYGTKFKERYAEVRQKASVIMGERIGLMKADMDSFADRLRARGFKDRSQAETYIGSNEALGILRSGIEELARQNPDAARELDRTLKVQIANIMFEIERGGLTTIAETGQLMERFGNTLFPKWEGEVHEKTKRQFSLVFIADKKTMGPGITPDKILGDIGIREINSRGKIQDTRLYEGMRDEDKYRLGAAISRQGDPLAPSYITQAEFREIIRDYADWSRGDSPPLRQEFNKKVKAIKDWYKQKQSSEGWKTKYKELLYDYAKFSADKHILIFNRIDNLKKAPETAFANGKGAVEKWHNYWVRDPATEAYLEEMAQILKMQLEQQSGILTIRGNPGAGKDVLVSMFSERTNRPYFGTDCTRWDTAYELSEDIVLESRDGASQTVHVPSTVLNGITTPGAIVYFNEIHALTEPAQIFLHALTDAKRRITLKTSSGKVIKALDSVVLMASMNPQVKDPIEPALRDRMVFMDVDYPPLYREKDPADPNSNAPIDASEALRIAREVKSLSDLTIENNMDRNEFVRMWDKYINSIDNGVSNPSQVQKFDMDVILATVQFANKLRENFVALKSGRSQIASRALPVSIPATGRPLRDCAYALSRIPDEQKIAGNNSDAIARTLLERWFLSKIDNIEDREKIKTAMATWTSQKRVAA